MNKLSVASKGAPTFVLFVCDLRLTSGWDLIALLF